MIQARNLMIRLKLLFDIARQKGQTANSLAQNVTPALQKELSVHFVCDPNNIC